MKAQSPWRIAGSPLNFLALNLVLVCFVAAMPASGQTNSTRSTNAPGTEATNPAKANTSAERDKVRAACIEGRRLICGRILELLPQGLIVESGYTNLLREPLKRSWLIPGTAQASKAENLIEAKTPGAICVGRVLLTNTPAGKKRAPAKYDYVIVEAYPAGLFTYTTVGSVQHTIRKFSANLLVAIDPKAQEKRTH